MVRSDHETTVNPTRKPVTNKLARNDAVRSVVSVGVAGSHPLSKVTNMPRRLGDHLVSKQRTVAVQRDQRFQFGNRPCVKAA
jgi:ATP-dependent Zn protease